ncbi:MAG: helix-turn-helix transcriptional regulator [Flavobacteriales bacterium]|jgi:transcriptional regulator with XRE-family HTH domain|nr:helix-turn-helix transcriptional regulator [Flavobacteriales bacterium]
MSNEIIRGLKIRHLREMRNLTQDHMARVLRIDPSKYSRIEGGKARPSPKELEAIAHELGVPAEELASSNPVMVVVNNSNGTQVMTDPHHVEQHTMNEEFMRDMVGKLDSHVQELTRLSARLTDLLERQLGK